ncbi:MAG: hypothetical protein ABR568_12875 [Pyrinomonadaceae bacterium]
MQFFIQGLYLNDIQTNAVKGGHRQSFWMSGSQFNTGMVLMAPNRRGTNGTATITLRGITKFAYLGGDVVRKRKDSW